MVLWTFQNGSSAQTDIDSVPLPSAGTPFIKLEDLLPRRAPSGMTAELLNARGLTCRPAFIDHRKASRELNNRVQACLLAAAARGLVMYIRAVFVRRKCVLLRRSCIDEQQQFGVTQAIPCPLSV